MPKSVFNHDNFKKNIDLKILRALTKVGLLIQGDARLICPVDTGNLKQSIDFQVDEKKYSVTIGTNVEYALAVEKGIGQKPQPYLTPAGEQNHNDIQKIFDAEMSDI